MGAKRNINEYLKLKVETPSLLHSCMLQLAYKTAKEDKINMGAFVKFWGLDNLRPEDYEQGLSDKGDTYPSTAEKVIQLATRHAFQNNATPELLYLLPFIDRCIMRFPENIWLKLNKAKALLATNQNQEAMSYGIQVVKNKPHDYWAWELLGDIHQASNTEKTFSCYCKALLCSKDIGFVSKVKIKLAKLLEKNELFPEAKLEIEQVIQYKTEKEHKIPQEAERLTKTHWFAETQSSQSNQELYTSHAPLAESILYENLPWYQAVIGNTFSTEDKQGKTKYKRKLYIKTKSFPLEVIIPESKLTFSKNNLGTGINIKGEFDSLRRFQVYAIDERKADSDWDIFTEQLCIVDHVNTKKKIIHFIFDMNIDGIIAFDDLSDRFREGDAILLRLAKYSSKQGTRYKALTASKTNQLPPETLLTTFSDEVRVSNGMGFTEDDIFIPPPLIEAHKVKDGSTVTGKAILNYNSKKSTWGWKAISLND
ncbi:MAG TPA: hypothetical protein DHW71_08030 [Gammaproteobacteria bacterium]|nr:hypothetical protein [Gammaproteobacteria bacterium]|tara:strand:+ start:58 stop:1500 length:1443 start_codon:yes stop_codon:yes gene_type:complete